MIPGVDRSDAGPDHVGACDAEVVVESLELGAGVIAVEQVVFGDKTTIDDIGGRGSVGGGGRSKDSGKLEGDDENGGNDGEGAGDALLA